MAKELTSAVETEIQQPAIFPATIYDVVPLEGAPLYLAEYNENIIFDGKVYRSFPISHQPVKVGLEDIVDHVSITLSTVDHEIIRLILSTNGLRKARVTITTVFTNLLEDPDNKIIAFHGQISSVRGNEQHATFTITSLFDLEDVPIPRRIYRKDRCSWVFKDPSTCKYVGSLENCDKSRGAENGCQAHDNLLNFGGFPNIPERHYVV